MEQDEVPPVPGFYVTSPNDTELYKYAMTEGAPDEGVYQLTPYGWGPGMGTEIGYRPYNPAIGPSLPPGPSGGMIGGSLQQGMGGGYGGLPGAGPTGGYSTPQPQMQMSPEPIPDPSVRFSPSNSRNSLLSRSSAEEITVQPKPSWNPFRRANSSAVNNNIQQTGNISPQPNGRVQPADFQTQPGRYR